MVVDAEVMEERIEGRRERIAGGICQRLLALLIRLPVWQKVQNGKGLPKR